MVEFKDILASNVWNFIEIKFGFALCTSLLLKLKLNLDKVGVLSIYEFKFRSDKDNYFKKTTKKT
jgi:hypothetical protein